MGRYSQAVLITVIAVAVALIAVRPAAAQSKLDQARKHFDQGEAYFKAGTWDKAIDEYNAAYALVPRPGLLFNIGLCYEHLEQPSRAVDYYDRYLKAAPDGGKATEARARREAQMRLVKKQRADADRAKKAAGERAAGKNAMTAGDYDQAIAHLTSSYQLAPEPEVLFELAEAHRAKGDDILAAEAYRRYLAASETGTNRAVASERLRTIEARAAAMQDTHTEAQPAETRTEHGSLVPAIVAYSVAGAATIVGVAYGLSSSSTLSGIDDQLDSGNPPLDSGDPRFADGRRAARNANIAYAAAGVAAIAGAVLTWHALRTEHTVIVPRVTGDGAAVSLEVTW